MSGEDPWFPTKQVLRIAGGVSVMCLWRWQRDERVQFPPPDARINGRNYWKASTIAAWQDRMAARDAMPTTPSRPSGRPRKLIAPEHAPAGD